MKQWVNPRVAVLALGTLVEAVLDESERIHQHSQEALELARKLDHPHTLAFALTYLALANQYHQNAPDTLRLAEECIALSSEHRFRIWLLWSRLLRGWALARLGQPKEGLLILERGLKDWNDSGVQAGKHHHNLSMLAEVYLWNGRTQDALSVLDRAIAHMMVSWEHSFESPLYRLRGEALHMLGRVEEAREDLLHALSAARLQSAHAFERFARESLARLFQGGYPTADQAT